MYHEKCQTGLSYGKYIVSTNADVIFGAPGSGTNSVGVFHWSP